MIRKIICLFGIITLIFVVLTVSLFPESPDESSLRILVPKTTSSLPLMLLADEDPIPGLDIKTEIFINHPQALVLLIRGEADLIFAGTSQGWENYLNGGPLIMVNTGNWGVSYLMGRDESIKSFSDLKGRRIALPFPGAPLDFQTRYILIKKGIDPDRDLVISYSPLPQTVPRLLLGQLDVAPLPEPLATNLAVNKGLKRLIDYKQAWADVSGGDPMSPQVSLFAHISSIPRCKDTIVELVRHWRRTTQYVQQNPEKMAGTYALVLGQSSEIIEEAIGNTLFSVPSFAENKRRVLAYYNEVRDLLPGSRPPLGEDFFFTPSND